MNLDDFTLINAVDSSSINTELASDSLLGDLFPGAFDSLVFRSFSSSVSPSLLYLYIYLYIMADMYSRQIRMALVSLWILFSLGHYPPPGFCSVDKV